MYHFCLTIKVCSKIKYFTVFITLRDWVFFVTGNSRYVKAFNIGWAFRAVLVNHVIGSALVFLFKYSNMNDVFTYKGLTPYLGDHHCSILGKYNNIINITTICYILVFTQVSTYKPFLFIYIKLGISNNYLGFLNIIKYLYFCFTLFTLTVFFL